MRFHKYQGLGNDYLVVQSDATVALSVALVRRLCDRHYGVGADGVLLGGIDPERGASVRIFNPDGSEAEKSGNGLRIFARYLWDAGLVGDQPFDVQTKGGVVRCQIQASGARVVVDMGQATFDSTKIPVTGPAREVVDEELTVSGERLRFTAVSVGNPHCVIHVREASSAEAHRLGPLLETHALFPNRTNVQFVQVIDANHLRIEIWERGAGYTLASGSSSCAAAAASLRLGRCRNQVTVTMPGGDLSITVSDSFAVQMTGPVGKIADGTVAPELLEG